MKKKYLDMLRTNNSHTRSERLDAIKKYKSLTVAASRLGIEVETLRLGIPWDEYGEHLRQPPVIGSEFNDYVVKTWR